MNDEVGQMFRKVFLLDDDFQLRPDMSFDEVPGWDSVGHVNLVGEIESRFGVSLGIDAIVSLDSVQAVRDIVKGSG